MDVTGFIFTAESKMQTIQSLVLAFERAECQWRDEPAATAELHAYESKISHQTGRISYSAPDGMFDDTITARALAWRAITNRVVWEVA